MSAVRIAVAGAGLIGTRHIEEIGRSARARLTAIVDVSAHGARVAAGLGVASYGCLEELFERDKPEGLILATPNRFHADQALQCIDAGIPALVEKPLASTVEEGVRMCEASERSGVAILVGHHRRHGAILRAGVQVMRSGVLGKVIGVMGSAVFYKPDSDGYYEGPNAWRREPGGGPILINMIHEIDCLRALMGEIVAVQAMASNATRGFEVEDTVTINLRFENGALGAFLLSDTGASPKSWEQTSRENAAFFTDPSEDCYTIIGTRGSLGIPTMRLKQYERDADRSWNKAFTFRTLEFERHDPLQSQLDHFTRVVRGEAAPLVNARDGLQNLRVSDAIAHAAKQGGSVDVAIH